MANIVITKTGNAINLVFNNETQYPYSRAIYRVNNIAELHHHANNVMIEFSNGAKRMYTSNHSNTNKDIGIVDSVGGVNTTTLTILFDELEKMIQ